MIINMSIKTATKFGMIGAIITIFTYIIYILLNTETISLIDENWDYEKRNQVYEMFNVIMNLCGLFSASSLATFFYVLHKNQK